MTRRVLLASLNAGGGHHALRDSFAAALARVDPEQQRLGPLVWTSADTFIDWFYSVCVRFLPRFQGKIVELSGQPWAVRTAMALSPQLRTEALALLRRESVDLLLSTHPVQSMTFAQVRRELGLTTPLVLAVPDYGVPATGYHPPLPALRADALIVMEESTLEHYRSLGVPDDWLHLSGFLTREPFVRVGARLRAEGQDTARAAFKAEVVAAEPDFARFDLSRPTLLFLGGSAWTVKTEPVLEAVLADAELREAVNVVVVAGRDRAFEARLRARASRRAARVRLRGARGILAALMGLAQVPVLGSLAPATLQELLEVGLGPLLLFHFIPGSERAHVGYIDGQRLGLYVPDSVGDAPPHPGDARSRAAVGSARTRPRRLPRAGQAPPLPQRGARAAAVTLPRADAGDAAGHPRRRARGRLAPVEALVRLDMLDAGFHEDGSDRPIAVALVEAERVELRVHEDAGQSAAPRLPLQLAEEKVSDSVLAVRLENRHPADLSPGALLALRSRREHHQSTGPDRVTLGEHEQVVGPCVLGVALDRLRDVLLLDEDDLADRQRLEELRLVLDLRDDELDVRGAVIRGPQPTASGCRL